VHTARVIALYFDFVVFCLLSVINCKLVVTLRLDCLITCHFDKAIIMLFVLSLILLWAVLYVDGLSGPYFRSLPVSRSRPITMLSSTNNNNDDLNAMRSMLESSWDSDTMGQVPSDSAIAANEAFLSILSAADSGVSVFFIDLLLPSYDVTQGSNLYDEVLAVEYCIALADCLKEKSSILVRDDKTVETVQRILNRREEERLKSQPAINISDGNDGEDEEEEAENGEDDVPPETEDDGTTEVAEEPSDPESDMDLFRQQLLSTWDSDDGDKPESKIPEQSKIPPKSKEAAPASSSPKTLSEKRYRLASLFGNARISEGPDMIDNVLDALRANALPKDDEETLIVLSAITLEEMVAVRSLVSKYGAQKKIILVNCKLNPIPKELYGAETVYSILPLIARPANADSQVAPQDGKSQPKVLVLRRYPGAWQVFVDVGQGFKLAKSAPSDMSNRRGPPIQWIQQVVQQFTQS
jgi:hypothetical protein